MNDQIKWLVQDGEGTISIELSGMTRGGASVSIDGVESVFPMMPTQSTGYYTVLPAGSREYVLITDQKGQNAQLRVDGVLQPALTVFSPNAVQIVKWEKTVKSGRRDLMAMIILTVFNLAMLLLGLKIAIPFYVFSAYVSAVFGQQFSMIYSNSLYQIAGLIIAFAMIGCFLLLYFKAKRFVWPAWVAFGLVIADTIIYLIVDYLANLTTQQIFASSFSFLIMLITHVWMISDMAKMALAQAKLAKVPKLP